MEKEIKGGGGKKPNNNKMNLQRRNTAVIWSRELGPGVMLTVIPNIEHCPVTLPASLGGRSVSHKGNLVFILAKLLKW